MSKLLSLIVCSIAKIQYKQVATLTIESFDKKSLSWRN